MSLKNILKKVKERWLTILIYVLLAIVIFSPGAKSWMLQQIVSTGLLKADIKDKNLQQAQPFLFTDIDGETASTADLKGKIVFINFWASWCPPCRAEMPDLQKLYEKLRDDKRFFFLFINEDQDRNKGIDYLSKNHFSLPYYFRSGDVSPEIFSGSLPTTVVINKKGEIVLKHEGMARYNSDNFIRQLKVLL